MPVFLQYYFWLISISVLCFGLERIYPWQKSQKMLRKGIWQDLFWLVFNGHYLGLTLALLTGKIVSSINVWLGQWGWPAPDSLALMADSPLWAQFIVFFILKDFIEWNIHRMLHNIPYLWEFHKLHHSIEELDWIGNFRFHWGEVVVYKTLSYLPLVVLGIDSQIVLIIAVLGTFIQDLNHANLPINWGSFRYLFNSPKMHIWHHDVELHGKGGQNFGIALSIWDWIFGTVYWPTNQERPAKLGFAEQGKFPDNLLERLIYPVRVRKNQQAKSE